MHSYLRCASCGLIYVARRPSLENLERAYLRVHLSDYQVDHKRDWAPWKAHKHATLDALGVRAPTPAPGAQAPSALDLGCGEGPMLEVLQQRGWQAHGLELNPAMAQQARDRGFEVFEASLESPTPPPGMRGRFALISFNHLVEHLRDPLAATRAAAAWLAPGGSLLVETPLRPDHTNIDHLFCFSTAALDAMLRRAGLRPRRWFDYVDDNYGHHNLACVAIKQGGGEGDPKPGA